MSRTLAGLSSSSPPSISMAVTNLTTPHDTRPCTENLLPDDLTAEKTRRYIDQEIQKLEDSIRSLKSHRNLFAPISRLPPEILAKVFMFRVTESVESSNPLGWIVATHVSRHWRAAALDCPSLWGNLVFTSPKWSEEMLKRSKMARLIVNADITYVTPRIFEVVRLALLQGSRVHELHLRASSANLKRLLNSENPFEPSMIRSLSLSVPQSTRFGTDEGFDIGDNMFIGEMPYLRKLKLQKCNIDWDTPLLNGLTHLTVHDIPTSARPSMEQLLSALEKMPHLEILDFQDSLPQMSAQNLLPQRTIDLGRLKYLNIASTVPECVDFINKITIPASARIHLSCSGTEATGSDFSGIMKVISNPGGTSDRTSGNATQHEHKIIRVLHVLHEAPVSLVVRGWTNLPLNENQLRRCTPDIQLQLSWHHTPQTRADVIAIAICKSIPVARLRSLQMLHVAGMSKNTWSNTFGFLPRLQTLHVAGDSAHSLIEALCEDIPISYLKSPVSPEGKSSGRRPSLRQRRSTPIIFFPYLKTLTLEEVEFEENAADSPTRFNNLHKCLLERSNRRADIQDLRLRECNHLRSEEVDELKNVVQNVDWDGLEQGFSDQESSYGYDDMGSYIFGGYSYDEDLESNPGLEFPIF